MRTFRASLIGNRLFAIILLALIVRGIFLSVHQRPLFSDEKDFDNLGYHLATHSAYTQDYTPTAYRPPGYPLFLSVIYFLFGHRDLLVKIVQALIDVLNVILIVRLAESRGVPNTTAALIWALYPPAILYSNLVLSETLFTALVLWSTLLFSKHHWEQWQTSLFFGFVCGAATLIKPEFVLVVLFLPFVLRKKNVEIKKHKFAVAAFLLVISPWIIRNYTTFGIPVLSTNSGINLLIGNNPEANGGYNTKYLDRVLLESSNEVEKDRQAFHLAVQYIGQHPGRVFLNCARKLAHFFSSEGGLLVLSFDHHPEETMRSYTDKYSGIAPLWIALVNLPYFLVVILGLLGFLSHSPDRLSRYFQILGLSFLLIHLIFFGGSRFHFPLVPFLVLFTAETLPRIRYSFSTLTAPKKIGFVVISAAMMSLWTVELLLILRV